MTSRHTFYDPDAASRTYTLAAAPGRAIAGPHVPAATCPTCVDLFRCEPPSGCASIRDAADLFASVEHMAGYTALRPTPRYRLRPRSILSRGQGLAEYALLLSLVVVCAMAALVVLSAQVSDLLRAVGSSV